MNKNSIWNYIKSKEEELKECINNNKILKNFNRCLMINSNESMSYSLNNISTHIRSSLLLNEIFNEFYRSTPKSEYTIRQKAFYIRELESG